MDYRIDQKKRQQLTRQRTLLFGILGVLLFIVLLQSFALVYRSERTIILPPETKQSFWVEGNSFSPIYLN